MKRTPWWLAALFACSAAVAAQAPAGSGNDDGEAYRRAGDRFATLVAEAAGGESGDRAARLRTPEFARLVQTLSDAPAVLGDAPVPAADLQARLAICDTANRALAALALFDPPPPSDPDPTPEQVDAAMSQLMERNIIAFQREMKALQPFLVRCMSGLLPGLAEFMAALPPDEFTDLRRRGLAKTRSGVMMIYTAAQALAEDVRLGEDYRLALLSVLSDTAAIYAAATPMGDRATIASGARAASLTASAPYRAHLAKIATAFSSQNCSGLCAIE